MSPDTAPADLVDWRKAERARLLALRESVPLAVRRRWNETITALLVAGFDALASRPIGFYWPYRGEPDPRFFLRTLRDRGSRTALPLVIERKGPLEFREWWPGAPTTPGVFGLPMPAGTEVIHPAALLIPPVGFDEQGYRLGYGGGYFDRTLAAMSPQPLKIAVAFEVARVPTIHPQPHDVPMDFVVTEAGVHAVVDDGLVRCDVGALRARVDAMLRAPVNFQA